MAKRAAKEINHLADLVPDPQNARIHTPRNIGTISDGLREVGAARSIVIDENGVVLAGNGVVESAAEAGIHKVQVVDADGETIIAVRRSGLTSKQKKRLALIDNRANEMSSWDAEVLAQMAADGVILDDLWSTDELSALLGDALQPEAGSGGDEFDTTPDEEQTRVQYGDLWQCGNHRVLCGDSTKAADVARLMGGEKAQAAITDPPFSVRDDQWDKFDSLVRFQEFTTSWMKLAAMHCDVLAVFFADKFMPLLYKSAEQAGAAWRRSLIWRKPPGSQFAGASLDGYWYDFEIIGVFGRPTFKPDKHTKMAVMEHRTVTGQEHGCEKPVDLLIEIISGYSERGANLYEPFCGTGTVLVAGQRMGRKVLACEQEPKNVNVCLSRFEAETGQTAELLERAS